MFRKGHFLREENDGNGNDGGGSGSDDQNNNNNGGDSGNQNQNEGDSGNQSQSGDDDQSSGNDGIDSLPEATQKLIKDLRSENAKYRTEKKALSGKMENFEGGLKKMLGIGEDDDTTPEQKLQAFSERTQQLEMQNAMTNIAYQNNVSPADYDYFEFLLGKKLEALEDDQELPESELDDVLAKIRDRKAGGDTSTGGGNNGTPPKGGSDEITQADFDAMGTIARSKLFREKPELYKQFTGRK